MGGGENLGPLYATEKVWGHSVYLYLQILTKLHVWHKLCLMACCKITTNLSIFVPLLQKSGEKPERMSSKDAAMFPIIASCTLLGLYIFFKVRKPLQISINKYLCNKVRFACQLLQNDCKNWITHILFWEISFHFLICLHMHDYKYIQYIFLWTKWEICTEEYFVRGLCTDQGILPKT